MKKFIIPFICIFTLLCNSHLIAQESNTYQLSTHILDINRGQPASGVLIELYKFDTQTMQFEKIDSGTTDDSGRIANFLSTDKNNEGTYKLKFEISSYFKAQNIKSIYPYIEVIFQIEEQGHYHIPITVSANGYSTYRGS